MMDSEDFKEITEICRTQGIEVEHGKDTKGSIVTFIINGIRLRSFDTYRSCSYDCIFEFLMGFSKAKELHDKFAKGYEARIKMLREMLKEREVEIRRAWRSNQPGYEPVFFKKRVEEKIDGESMGVNRDA